jgi:hypothetical protein
MILISIISLIILSSIIYRIFIPLSQGISQALINRNDLLTIENNNFQIINIKIIAIHSLNGYVEINRNSNFVTS